MWPGQHSDVQVYYLYCIVYYITYFYCIMLCYVMLCCVCYILLCYITSCYVIDTIYLHTYIHIYIYIYDMIYICGMIWHDMIWHDMYEWYDVELCCVSIRLMRRSKTKGIHTLYYRTYSIYWLVDTYIHTCINKSIVKWHAWIHACSFFICSVCVYVCRLHMQS